jgi:endoglucanase
MKRRQFSIALGSSALTLGACGGDADSPAAGTAKQVMRAALGTNLSGMEWARPGLRLSTSSAPNLHFTVPRAADIRYLALNGFTRNRLPIQWELLQPMLHDTSANEATRSVIGQPGAFHPAYEGWITGVLDAHAAAGIECIIDLHNYCRYQDFRFQPDGSVTGLSLPDSPLLRPFTRAKDQVQVRIFALVPGATLTSANFNDFWRRAASRWKGHPGLGGYGLMNEPHDLPQPGQVTASSSGEDLTIWPTLAQSAIHAIRAVDDRTPIYVAGNRWSSAMSIAKDNPGFPLNGTHLVYEVHLYLDAFSNGQAFDWDSEVGKNFSAGIGAAPINVDTGSQRIKIAIDWAQARGVRLALTEIGMPIDDPRWEESFRRAVNLCQAAGCEVQSWMGGNHWPIRNYALNQVPGWHQHKTLEPAVSGLMKAASGIAKASLYDDGPGHAPAGMPRIFTVYARGHLATPISLSVSSSPGGALSKTQLTLPAGANGQDSFSFIPANDQVSTLSYRVAGPPGSPPPPPPRKVYSWVNPLAHAALSLTDAAMAILAKYNACKWEMADGYTDYVQGLRASDGQTVRAVADSGFGSSQGNAMEMLNWINTDNHVTHPMGSMVPPVMRTRNGKIHTDHTAADTWGFWCKKSDVVPGLQPRPRNRMPYNLEDAHFAIAAVSVPGLDHTGSVFQASRAESRHRSELGLASNQPQLRFVDAAGQTLQLTGSARLRSNTPAVLTMTCQQGAQALRLNSTVVARGNARFTASPYTQMLLGWGFLSYAPQPGFRGHLYAVITGKGVPDPAEMALLERYLGLTAGLKV